MIKGPEPVKDQFTMLARPVQNQRHLVLNLKLGIFIENSRLHHAHVFFELVHQATINICILKSRTVLCVLSYGITEKMVGVRYAWCVLLCDFKHISHHLGIFNGVKLAKVNRLQNCVLFERSEDCPYIFSFKAHV